jgi:hypothetical protein
MMVNGQNKRYITGIRLIFPIILLLLYPARGIGEQETGQWLAQLAHKHPQKRLEAIFQLKKLGDYRALKPLVKQLGDTNRQVREAAARALLHLQALDPVKELIPALQATNPLMRRKVRELLGKFRDYRAMAALDRLSGPHPGNAGHMAAGGTLPFAALLVSTNRDITRYRFDRKAKVFKKDRTYALQFPRHLAVSGRVPVAAAPDRLVVFDSQLNKTAEKEMGELGAMALYRDYILVCEDGFLKAFNLNLEEIAGVRLIPKKTNPKNAHDIIVYQDSAYLLDNIIYPIYILKIDLLQLDSGRLRKDLTIELLSKDPPHLDCQWLIPGSNDWVVVGTGADSPGFFFSGSSQWLFFYAMEGGKGFNRPIFRDAERYYADFIISARPHSFNRIRIWHERHDMFEKKEALKNKPDQFQILGVSAVVSPHVLIRQAQRYYLVNIHVSPNYVNEQKELFSTQPLNRAFLSNYLNVGKSSGFPGGANIRLWEENGHLHNLIYLSIHRQMLIVDPRFPAQPVFKQQFPNPIRDFVLLSPDGR